MTKRVGYYKRLKSLREDLAELAESPVDATDVDGAETKLHATKVVVALDKRLLDMFSAMTSDEQHDVIKSGL